MSIAQASQPVVFRVQHWASHSTSLSSNPLSWKMWTVTFCLLPASHRPSLPPSLPWISGVPSQQAKARDPEVSKALNRFMFHKEESIQYPQGHPTHCPGPPEIR